ncbi:sugar transporter domain-containing protein [Hirsutella rhossiliensis]|uniref:Sugar transporter domain-containing protein n=1 Tax=Hirsutella rhossiliensis TaxID=111463 RepID=A0A9P8MKY7_9HYPO|nr:sugar transporter domain-containing protein [Hirsutella rhossiliensis]KAH0956970.1 sugar transporter domain-containing protein [Hirsutella rhossiliensis]
MSGEKTDDAFHGRKLSELIDNSAGEIRNPLKGIPREELLQNVARFQQEKGLPEDILPLLTKGALVAQDPAAFEDLPDLNDHDRRALRKNRRHPRMGSDGLKRGQPSFPSPSLDHRLCQLHALHNHLPLCRLDIRPLNDLLGRRGVIFVAAISLAGALWHGRLPDLGTACRPPNAPRYRHGTERSHRPVFSAENSPAIIRGGLVMSWQVWTAFKLMLVSVGIFLGTCANLAVGKTGAIAWRLQFASAFIPAVPPSLAPTSALSPRWCLKKKKDLYYINCLLEQEEVLVQETGVSTKSNMFTRFVELFTIPRIRRATWASGIVMISQQLAEVAKPPLSRGKPLPHSPRSSKPINIISFYSSTIFKQSGISDYTALSSALYLSKYVLTLLAAGLCYLIEPTVEQSTARIAAVATFVYLFAAFYSPGEGPVPFMYSAEVFPLSHREIGMSWAVATNNFGPRCSPHLSSGSPRHHHRSLHQ